MEEENGIDLLVMIGIIVIIVAGMIAVDRWEASSKAFDFISINHPPRIWYCPVCKTIYGKFHACCPAEVDDDGKCVPLLKTPYTNWDEYRKGDWRP